MFWIWPTCMVLIFLQLTYLPISMCKLTVYHKEGWFQVATFSLHDWSSISTLVSAGGGPVSILNYQSMWALLHLGKYTTSWHLDWMLSTILGCSVSYVFPPLALASLLLSMFLTQHVTGQFRLPILVAPCWMEASWLPTVLNMLVSIPHCFPITKHLSHGCFSRHSVQGTAIPAFNPLAA